MKESKRVLTWVVFFLGLLASLALLGQRLDMEQGDRMAAAAFPVEDLAALAEESGLSPETWRAALTEAGVTYWIEEGVARAADGSAAVLPSQTVTADLPAVLIEDHTRTTMYAPEGVDPAEYQGPVVKGLYLYEDYGNRATETEAGEIQDLLFRGVTDRGLRLLILRPFTTAEGEMVTDPEVYADCLAGLTERLADRGISFGGEPAALELPDLQVIVLLLASLLPLSAGIWLVERLHPLGRFKLPLLLLAVVGDAGVFLLAPELAQTGWMLLAAILMPCGVICWAADCGRRPPHWLTERPLVVSILIFSGGVLLGTLAGGLTVAALMTSRVYLLGAAVFSGVKLALVLPLAFGGVLLLRAVDDRLPWATWQKGLLGLGAVVLVALLVFRSGDAGMSGAEASVRAFLEQNLYARPRSKELLIAVPCIPLFCLAVRRGMALLTLLTGLGVSLECVSVVNTFCHAVSPLRVSSARTLLAFGGGLILGFVLTLVLWALGKGRRKQIEKT